MSIPSPPSGKLAKRKAPYMPTKQKKRRYSKKRFSHIRSLKISSSEELAEILGKERLSRGVTIYMEPKDKRWKSCGFDPRFVAPTWRNWLRDAELPEDKKKVVVDAFTRMTLGDGPENQHGFLGTVNSLIDRLTDCLGETPNIVASVVHKLSMADLRFKSSHELAAFAKRMYQIALAHPDAFDIGDADFNPKSVALLASSALLCNYTEEEGWTREPHNLPEPQDFEALLSAIRLITSLDVTLGPDLKIKFDQEVVTTTRLWERFALAKQRGFSQRLTHKMLKEHSAEFCFMTLSLIEREILTPDALIFCFREPGFLVDAYWDDQIMRSLLAEWEKAEKPCDLMEFWEAGGRAQDWERHLDQQRSVQKPSSTTKPTGGLATPVRPNQTPTGRKRHHANFIPAEKSTDVDFGALCSELNVHAHFPDLDEALTRVVLVYGLLRDGDRLTTDWTKLPSRDGKKLWRQVKGHVEASSRKQFTRELRPLLEAHLVTFKRGNYSLALPNTRFPKAHQLLTQLRGLMAKYAT